MANPYCDSSPTFRYRKLSSAEVQAKGTRHGELRYFKRELDADKAIEAWAADRRWRQWPWSGTFDEALKDPGEDWPSPCWVVERVRVLPGVPLQPGEHQATITGVAVEAGRITQTLETAGGPLKMIHVLDTTPRVRPQDGTPRDQPEPPWTLASVVAEVRNALGPVRWQLYALLEQSEPARVRRAQLGVERVLDMATVIAAQLDAPPAPSGLLGTVEQLVQRAADVTVEFYASFGGGGYWHQARGGMLRQWDPSTAYTFNGQPDPHHHARWTAWDAKGFGMTGGIYADEKARLILDPLEADRDPATRGWL